MPLTSIQRQKSNLEKENYEQAVKPLCTYAVPPFYRIGFL